MSFGLCPNIGPKIVSLTAQPLLPIDSLGAGHNKPLSLSLDCHKKNNFMYF